MSIDLDFVTSGYVQAPAIEDVSLSVETGQVCALIGANGAGKTTTLRTISGLLRLRHGRIRLDGEDVGRWRVPRIVRAGVAHVPEGRRILTELTVAENLRMGAWLVNRDHISEIQAEVLDLFPHLTRLLNRLGGSLSGGEQQMLAIGRALMSRPKFLLLDEPSMGLAPRIVEMIFEMLPALRDTGLGILLVEQNAAAALEIADVAHVMEHGRIVLSGTGQTLREDSAVRDAYLGI